MSIGIKLRVGGPRAAHSLAEICGMDCGGDVILFPSYKSILDFPSQKNYLITHPTPLLTAHGKSSKA